MNQHFDPCLPDGDLPDDLTAFAQRIRAFAAEKLAPFAREIDERRIFRREMVADLAAAGILGGPLLPAHGGAGWSALQLALAHEEIGAVCGNARGFLAVQTGLVAQCLERFGSEAQQAHWLPRLSSGTAIGSFGLTEEDAGSDVVALGCRATRDGDGYRINGHKIWNTNGGIADVTLVFATVDPAAKRDGITAFLVETDRPGFVRKDMDGVDLGHRGSSHARLEFEDVAVGPDAVVGGIGRGFEVAMGGLHAGRLSVAAGAVGIQRAALACAREHCRTREQFGRSLDRFQMVQERLADMTVELLASRALVHRCAARRDAGIEHAGDLAAAKLYATEAASRAADQAIMLLGGRGYSSAAPAERLLRDSLGLRIYEGTSMIQKGLLARALNDG